MRTLYFAAVVSSSSSCSSFFLAYFQRSQIRCLPYFHTWCGFIANLECWSVTCCTRLTENTGCKIYSKNLHLRTIAQLCQAISSQLRHISTIGKKLIKQQDVLHMSSQYGERWPTSGWDWFGSLGHPSKFQRVSHLGFVTAPSLNRGQPNFARCLAVSWAATLCMHFCGFLPPNRILPHA